MSNNRARIMLFPLRTTIYGLQGLGGSLKPPADWAPIADIKRGDGTGGVMVQHRRTGMYVIWTGVGSIESLPQHKIAPALAAAGITS